MVTTKALIMVRSGSQRVLNKNFKPFANSNLLEIKINQMKRIKSIDGIVVNSNDDEMLDFAKSMGCETIKRDSYYATDEISPNELYVNLAETFPADVVVFANTTSPLVKDETFEKTIKTYFENLDRYDSLNTGHLIKEFLWQNGKAINYNPAKKPRSQDLPDIISLDSAVNVIAKERMIECRNFVGKTPYIYVVDSVEGLEIDYPLDFEFAEFLYKKFNNIK